MPFPLNVVAAASPQIITMIAGTLIGASGFDKDASGSMTPNNFKGEVCEFLATATIGTNFFFALNGTGIPNTDATFNRLEITGQYNDDITRTIVTLRSAMTYSADTSGNTQWNIDPGTVADNFVNSREYKILYI